MLLRKATASRTAGVNQGLTLKFTRMSENITRRSKLESGRNKQDFGLLSTCVCKVLVERCWVQGQGLRHKVNRTEPLVKKTHIFNILLNDYKKLACLLV